MKLEGHECRHQQSSRPFHDVMADVQRKQPMALHASDSHEGEDSHADRAEGGFLQLFMDALVRGRQTTSSDSSADALRENRPTEHGRLQ